MDGTIVDIGGAHLDAAGYDLLGLIVGSEGQIGIVTEASFVRETIGQLDRVVAKGVAPVAAPVHPPLATTTDAVANVGRPVAD